jgi:hypothetical protein
MDRTRYYRERADHFRQLADLTWQERLETMLRDLAEEYEHMAHTEASIGRVTDQEKPEHGDTE